MNIPRKIRKIRRITHLFQCVSGCSAILPPPYVRVAYLRSRDLPYRVEHPHYPSEDVGGFERKELQEQESKKSWTNAELLGGRSLLLPDARPSYHREVLQGIEAVRP